MPSLLGSGKWSKYYADATWIIKNRSAIYEMMEKSVWFRSVRMSRELKDWDRHGVSSSLCRSGGI